MNVMEEPCAENEDSRFHSEPEMNEVQKNSIHMNKSGLPKEGASAPESQDPDVEDEEELSRLKALTTDVREQVDLERDVGRQVCYSINFMNPTYLNGLSGGPVAHRTSQ